MSGGGTLRRRVRITGLLVADGHGTVSPVVLLVGLRRGRVWLPTCVIPPRAGRLGCLPVDAHAQV